MLAASSGVQAFDFKGLVIGEPTTAAQVEERFATCVGYDGKPCDEFRASLHERGRVRCGSGYQGAMVCNGLTTVAGFVTQANIVIGADGTLQRVMLSELDPDNFEEIEGELKQKFGRPKSRHRSVVQNAYGAQFQQVECEWADSHGGRIEYSKYAGDVTRSTLYFSSAQDRERLNPSVRGAKGDL